MSILAKARYNDCRFNNLRTKSSYSKIPKSSYSELEGFREQRISVKSHR